MSCRIGPNRGRHVPTIFDIGTDRSILDWAPARNRMSVEIILEMCQVSSNTAFSFRKANSPLLSRRPFPLINKKKNEWYDRYEGTKELLPYAKAVSAKTYDFDESRPFVTVDNRWGKETDYRKMMQIVVDSDYEGWIGIEYEGGKLDEYAGIKASKELLERSLAEVG